LPVAPVAHNSESKNHEAPILNMTRKGKCHYKKSWGKNKDFSPGFLVARYGV
jgi:hypothetical protein